MDVLMNKVDKSLKIVPKIVEFSTGKGDNEFYILVFYIYSLIKANVKI